MTLYVAYIDKSPKPTVQVARKEYTCEVCKEPIKVGEKYWRDTIAPWQNVEADADDEGKTVYYHVNSGKWDVRRAHNTPHCYRSLDEYDY